MFDENKPIEYHYQRRKWYEAVLISYSSNNYVIKFRRSPTDYWIQRTVGSISFDKIRNVESTEMFDKDKPIEYHFDYREWREAVLLDSDFNGSYLIKHRKSPTSSWQLVTVGQKVAKEKIRNVPEKLIYRVILVKDVDTPCVWSTTVDKVYSIGDKFKYGTVVAYHEGEYTE